MREILFLAPTAPNWYALRMIFTDGTEIRNDDTRHKFGSAMAEYLYGLDPDEQGGDVQFSGWFGRFGKRILTEDSMGFVNCEKFDTPEQAQEVFDEWLEAEANDDEAELLEVEVIHGDVIDALWAHDDGSDS